MQSRFNNDKNIENLKVHTMKRSYFTIFSILICLLISQQSFGQELSKQERKDLIKQIKELKKNPERYKNLIETNKSYRVEVEDLYQEIDNARAEIAQLEEVVAFQDEQLKNCKQGGMGANNGIIGDIASSSEGSETGSQGQNNEESSAEGSAGTNESESISINTNAPSGESYRIQIGFYDKRDLSHLINNGLVMRYENVDGTMRYSLGDFSSPEEAAEFIQIIRPMLFNDSFISKYNSGVREMSFDFPVR